MTQILVNGMLLSANYALIALGITLIFSIMNVLNFAHGQMFMIGGFVVYYAVVVWGLPFPLGLLGALVIVGVIGMVLESVFFRRVMKNSSREENTMLLAVGTALLLENVALSLFGEKQRGIPPIISGVYRFGDAFLPANRLLVLGISLALIVLVLLFVNYSRTGRAMRALAQDRTATLLMGVDVPRISTLGFGLGAALAGIAGALLISISGVNAGIGTAISTKAFIMIMIGGAGVMSGALLGAVTLGFAEALGYAFFPGSVTYLIIFIGLILFLLFRPQGIMGKPWG
ncbi:MULTISPECIES: branched-chain amino acid ABC transporter permease [Kaistia]|uniref:Branched-chain amino acid ABC transporter permease n=1 Tax=Kaistia nematophila TaxID=2994654 RepID=A0A9X3E1F2_9HYPH|nr:branched-chain amino acid ABC transporter permease [Kaistia nematophila]MBN9025008.1 branched-chain amino acid ABC transporter permease [Hyphomicrobiales bacterium]MCX5569919.1 branched-chain amino acid ABC transporter permease [Kaistia nematophila]